MQQRPDFYPLQYSNAALRCAACGTFGHNAAGCPSYPAPPVKKARPWMKREMVEEQAQRKRKRGVTTSATLAEQEMILEARTKEFSRRIAEEEAAKASKGMTRKVDKPEYPEEQPTHISLGNLLVGDKEYHWEKLSDMLKQALVTVQKEREHNEKTIRESTERVRIETAEWREAQVKIFQKELQEKVTVVINKSNELERRNAELKAALQEKEKVVGALQKQLEEEKRLRATMEEKLRMSPPPPPPQSHPLYHENEKGPATQASQLPPTAAQPPPTTTSGEAKHDAHRLSPPGDSMRHMDMDRSNGDSSRGRDRGTDRNDRDRQIDRDRDRRDTTTHHLASGGVHSPPRGSKMGCDIFQKKLPYKPKHEMLMKMHSSFKSGKAGF
eukprot:TRINITY_DN16379_c0_g1_i1.p1 TRINITY_DN16379_c0_g1~~TRINITY_DN16379_c0_g1_i1.p1  ORF type:complete len:384 (+),score=108.70 TRINITY_DN16379_c0_g1_i1:260-1411(+)